MKTELYTIETLTNLHVGSGDINFDVIDNQVQRDPVTTLPNINASSLKGAFREHFESMEETKGMVGYIFGPENSSQDNHQTGAFSFFEAQLLTRPVRSNKKAYFNATSPKTLKRLLEMTESFGIDFDEALKSEIAKLSELSPKKDAPLIFEKLEGVVLEDFQAQTHDFDTSGLSAFLGDDLVLFDEESFKQIDLPVIARNALDEDGISQNLWYEEVVPKHTRFFFCIGKPDSVDPKDYEQKIKGFENRFENEGGIVQFGANKSIGYGFSRVKKASK